MIKFENLEIQENINFGKMTTMKIGGNCRFFTKVKSVEDIRSAIRFSKKRKAQFAWRKNRNFNCLTTEAQFRLSLCLNK